MTNFVEMQKRFIMNEGHSPPDMNSYIQALEEALSSIKPSTMKDHRRIAIAKENLRNIRSQHRKLQAEHKELQERVVQLEETSKKRR